MVNASSTQHQIILANSYSKRIMLTKDGLATDIVKIEPCLTNFNVQDMHIVPNNPNTQGEDTRDIAITFLSSNNIRGVWSEILFLLDKHEIDVIHVTFSTISSTQKVHYIYARVSSSIFHCLNLWQIITFLICPIKARGLLTGTKNT